MINNRSFLIVILVYMTVYTAFGENTSPPSGDLAMANPVAPSSVTPLVAPTNQSSTVQKEKQKQGSGDALQQDSAQSKTISNSNMSTGLPDLSGSTNSSLEMDGNLEPSVEPEICANTSVANGATYCIPGVKYGCGGDKSQPIRNECPKNGSIAVGDCTDTDASYNIKERRCILKENTICKRSIKDRVWRCTLAGQDKGYDDYDIGRRRNRALPLGNGNFLVVSYPMVIGLYTITTSFLLSYF